MVECRFTTYAEPVDPRLRPICVFSVAGCFAKLGAAQAIVTLKPGDGLELRREPDNEHDGRAVLVAHGDQLLGYVPAKTDDHKNVVIAALIDTGVELMAIVRRTLPERGNVEVAVYMRVITEVI